jgi:hypothetical protein
VVWLWGTTTSLLLPQHPQRLSPTKTISAAIKTLVDLIPPSSLWVFAYRGKTPFFRPFLPAGKQGPLRYFSFPEIYGKTNILWGGLNIQKKIFYVKDVLAALRCSAGGFSFPEGEALTTSFPELEKRAKCVFSPTFGTGKRLETTGRGDYLGSTWYPALSMASRILSAAIPLEFSN